MATKLADRPGVKKPLKTSAAARTQQPQRFATVMGFTLESESMPDNPAETLYTLTHPDLPGLVLGDSDPWQVILTGLDAAGHLLRLQMEAGEKLPMKSSGR
jgi:hypothetical protein